MCTMRRERAVGQLCSSRLLVEQGGGGDASVVLGGKGAELVLAPLDSDLVVFRLCDLMVIRAVWKGCVDVRSRTGITGIGNV